MKLQLESILNNDTKSFSMMFNPRLSDLFYWHFHPEYELVFIRSASGTRHVGDHFSTYTTSDLVLIGSNIPHLNFDYGVHGDYDKVVVHFHKTFVENHFFVLPEFESIKTLFLKSKYGMAVLDKKRDEIGNSLFELENKDPFHQYIDLIKILKILGNIQDVQLLHDHPYNLKHTSRDQDRLQQIYGFVDKNYHRKIELSEIARICNLSKEAFCRFFKKMTTYTFVEFLNRYRISHSKRYLMAGHSISEACYQCGFESLSYFNRIFKKITHENPRDFRNRYIHG